MTRGLSKVKKGALRYDAISLWRMRFRALRRLFRTGLMHLALKIDRDYLELLALLKDDPVFGNQYKLFLRDRRDFLAQAVPILFLNGWRRTADVLFRELRKLDPSSFKDLTADDYAFKALLTELSPGKATRPELITVLKALLRQSLWAWARGEEEGAREYYVFASDMHRAVRRIFGPALVPSLGELLRTVKEEERKRTRSGIPSAGGGS